MIKNTKKIDVSKYLDSPEAKKANVG